MNVSNMSRKKLHHAVLTLFATTVSASLAAPALAQTPQSVNRIEVTGSAIKRIEGETALPVTVITREDIDRSGAVGTEDLLRRITASTAMMSDTNQGVGYAVSNANLRGLGASSTLVLLNGRRLANHAFGSIGGFGGTPTAVDLNSIPFSAIDRVEVLRDGASAIYGTDAVGGVINFITRTDYRGAEVSANYGRPKNYGAPRAPPYRWAASKQG
jgi:iron complex outermembrane receptor protein